MRFIDPTGMWPDETVGADGLTNSQWMEASRPGAAVSLGRSYRSQNIAREYENLRKEPSIEVGELTEIERGEAQQGISYPWWTHEYIIRSAFSGNEAFKTKEGKGLIHQMVLGSKFADSSPFQDSEYSYMHAMNPEGEFLEISMMNTYQYIENQLQAFNDLLGEGRTKEAYFQLGMGMHPLMDMHSPSHNGWKTWIPGHVLRPSTWSGVVSHIAGELFTNRGVQISIREIQAYYSRAIK